MRRSVPLWRTDWRLEPLGTQCHSYGISSWLPLSGTGTGTFAAYDFRSNMAPFTNCIWDVRIKDADYDLMRGLAGQFRQLADCYLGDYYPLTPYSLENSSWLGWQFDRPDLGKGMVQVFRRPESPYESARFRLGGLDPDAKYVLTDLDTNQPREITGRELLERGLLVGAAQKPSAVVITYRRMP
jgi:alpha-galactosidase